LALNLAVNTVKLGINHDCRQTGADHAPQTRRNSSCGRTSSLSKLPPPVWQYCHGHFAPAMLLSAFDPTCEVALIAHIAVGRCVGKGELCVIWCS
jgi:hypothetical protein